MKTVTFILPFLFISVVTFGQNQRSGEPGKCYAKAYFDSKVSYDKVEVTYPTFIGDKNEDVKIETITLSIEPAITKWVRCPKNNQGVKIKSTVWCLVEHSEKIIEIQVVIDTSKTKNFILETFETYENVIIEAPENLNTWTEIICGKDLTKKLLLKIQEALWDEGYYKNEVTDYVTDELKTALINFQKSKDLPFGQFDKATIEALNITVR